MKTRNETIEGKCDCGEIYVFDRDPDIPKKVNLLRWNETIMKKKIILTLLLFKENDFWLAQCIEYNFLSQGNSPERTIHRMFQTIEAHIHFSDLDGREPFPEVKKASKMFLDKIKRVTSIISIAYMRDV